MRNTNLATPAPEKTEFPRGIDAPLFVAAKNLASALAELLPAAKPCQDSFHPSSYHPALTDGTALQFAYDLLRRIKAGVETTADELHPALANLRVLTSLQTLLVTVPASLRYGKFLTNTVGRAGAEVILAHRASAAWNAEQAEPTIYDWQGVTPNAPKETRLLIALPAGSSPTSQNSESQPACIEGILRPNQKWFGIVFDEAKDSCELAAVPTPTHWRFKPPPRPPGVR